MKSQIYSNGQYGNNVFTLVRPTTPAQDYVAQYDNANTLIEMISLTIFDDYINVHHLGNPINVELAAFHESVLLSMQTTFSISLQHIKSLISTHIELLLQQFNQQATPI